MLYELTFRTRNLTLPLAHQTKVQGMIYNLMSIAPEYSNFIHEEGYRSSNNAHFRLFTFSNLYGPHILRSNDIIFPETVSLKIRTADPLFGQLLNEVLRPGLLCALGKQKIILTEVQQEVLHLEDDCDQLTIRTISPIMAYKKLVDRHTHFYNPLDAEFSLLINKNYRRKWESATGMLPDDNVELLALSVGYKDRTIAHIKGTIITAWGGTYLLRGKPKAMEFLYHTGLGAKNSMGFGAFEILH